jgi:hypothetical protein
MAESRSAQQVFAAWLRDRIAPALRERGFIGSGQGYRLPVPGWIAHVGFQRSVHNDAAVVRFTINLQVVSQSAWDQARTDQPWLPAVPTPTTRYGSFVWAVRIGFLMPEQADRWWELTAATNLDRLADEILSAIDRSGIPAMRDRVSGGKDSD